MMWYWGGGAVHWWAWLFTTVGMVAFWALVIWGVVVLVRALTRGGGADRPGGTSDDSPERILARRFAAGEIDEDEFHRRLDALRRHETAPHP